MVKMSDEAKRFVCKRFPEIDLNTIKVNDLLDALDDLMCDSLDENYNPTEETRRIENAYDEIYCCN